MMRRDFISPTKTPEYLSSGLPVVSTAIRDVERPYGELGLAKIAHSVDEFIAASEQAMSADMCLKWRERADEIPEEHVVGFGVGRDEPADWRHLSGGDRRAADPDKIASAAPGGSC